MNLPCFVPEEEAKRKEKGQQQDRQQITGIEVEKRLGLAGNNGSEII